MILIITDEVDTSSFKLMDYLIHLDKNYKVINNNSNFDLDLFEINKTDCTLFFRLDDKRYSLFSIKSVWHRKRDIHIPNIIIKKKETKLYKKIYENLCVEREKLNHFIKYVIYKNSKILGNFFLADRNKLQDLYLSIKVGLQIPATIIHNNKNKINIGDNLVTKAIGEALVHSENKYNYINYTKKIDYDKIPNEFYHSLFQTEIKKKYELRVFYLLNKCYSMAIFSQNDKKTQTDFREYNLVKPNRFNTFKLPSNIERKVKKFMKLANLNTGSLDIIVDENDEYYFLEVNPVGQYGMVTETCNYNIENEICNFLID